MCAPNPFALGGRQNDEAVLTLFQRWIEGQRAARSIPDGDMFDAALDRIFDIEDEIATMPATSTAGLMAKVYITILREFGAGHNKDDAAGLAPCSKDLDCPHARFMAAIVRDLANFIPLLTVRSRPQLSSETG